MKLSDYWEMLDKFDWYYNMSDDHGIWLAGVAGLEKLKKISNESEEHKKLFEEFVEYRFSGGSFGSEQKPKPEKPKDD